MLFLISIGVALLVAVILFRVFFGNLPDFVEAVVRPGPSTVKVGIWAAVAIAVGISAYIILSRQIPQLAKNRDQKAPVAANTASKPIVAQARTQTSARATPAAATPPIPAEALAHGVKLGDNVQISALEPAIALRSAVITSMNETQLTIRANSGTYSILWKDLTGLKLATTSTNKPGQ